ncbi:uncharacterized protein LOC100890729 [Strongylocentrotus purpuratus]|uniref:EGF-like domain-containing protein n=1 Tax=Strongylocentrotus purpuratus TaxID=7668 RepID=A0A7M7NNJ1_STRPU|nr:uncharacterized protein LOC100890729 [Strongylocentrotus purpuratus]|eukprot:XP_003730786.1 PREDICTED: uncharacterized protein LOC100890729 [Strongylocentrotus purpuratus]
MAKTSDPEKKCENAPPDGVVKEGPEETAHGWPCLISLKRSSPCEEKESRKNSPGLKEKSEEIAASEQNTSKGKDRSLPCSNKKRKRKTWITELAAKVCILNAYEPKNKWMYLLITFGMLLSGAYGKGVEVKLKPSRYVSIATNKTIAATDPVPQAQSYLIFASGGNHPRSYNCTSDFVENNQNCNVVVGDKSKTECGGLRIFENETHTHLAVDGSKLTHDHTRFCIYQQAPGNFSLYFLVVYKNQDIDECASSPCVNGGMCVDGHDSYTCNCAKGYNGANCEIGSDSTYWKNASIILAIILAIIVILTLAYFLCCRNKSMEQVPMDDIGKGPFCPERSI